MINIKKRKLSGFSLVEMMISVSLTIIVMTMITQFLMNFSNMSSVEGKKSELSAELRVLNLRLEKEIEQGSSLLDSYVVTDTEYGSGTITSDSNRIIFTRQVYNKTTYMPASNNPRDTTKNDVVIIEYTGNNSATSVKYGDVLYSLIPASATASDTTYTKSIKIIKRKLNSSIINSSTDDSYSPENIFTYYDYSNNVQTGTNIKSSSLVQIGAV